MGAWGTGSFDNDDALDFVVRLEREGETSIRAAFEDVTGLDAGDYLEAPEASSAIAAGEVVAAARDGDVSRLPEAVHDWLLAMDDKGCLDPGHALAPGDQLGLIGMGGEAVDRVDRGAHLDLLAEHRDMLGAVDDPARQRTGRCIADEDHAGIRPRQIVPQVMHDAAAGCHT